MAKKPVKETIHAKGIDIAIYTEDFQNKFISLTDIARYKSDEPFIVINNWLRGKDTIEFLGLWEQLHNPDFKPIEFDRFRKEAGYNAFTLSPQKWINNTNAKGIISESYNAILIEQGKSQPERLQLLNKLAARQLEAIQEINKDAVKKLEGK